MRYTASIIAALLASPAHAEETRELDAHEHGVGALNIAFDGDTVAMEFHAPGADIVGFEHAAESAEDRSAIDSAVASLARPLELFVIPADAECRVTKASAGLEPEGDHEHKEHAGGHDHDDHEHEEHAEAHDDHHHAEASGHSEFHAEYLLTCGNAGAITHMDFAYFDQFEKAREVVVQIVSAAGARAFEVERGASRLDLRGMF
jgi:hypothetical protein